LNLLFANHLMPPLKTKTIGYSARLFLLTGMLASLCFSGGEGICLLPFPVYSVENGATPLLPRVPLRAYTPSLHHSGNGLVLSIKPQKSHRRNPTSSAKAADCKAALHYTEACQLARVDEVSHHTARLLLASLAARAPPAD
jgi:hypothetical protein